MAGHYSAFDLFIMQHERDLKKEHWDDISQKYELSEDMMRLYINKLNWYNIAKYQVLSSEFIKENIHYQLKEHMSVICFYQHLSPEFLEEFKDSVDWNNIIDRGDYPMQILLKYVAEIAKFKEENPEYDEIDH